MMRRLASIIAILSFLSAELRAADASMCGPLAVETIEFATLRDASRPSVADASERPRILPRRAAKTDIGSGRLVPVKVHLPAGASAMPLIIFSHGAGGDWDTHFAQAQHLASHGYVVICIEHVGSNRERLTQGIRLMQNIDAMIHDADEVLTRPKDISFVIDWATKQNEAEGRLQGRIDLSRIGIIGHSFGAYTAMVTCGMRPALDWLRPTVAPGKGLGPDLSDRRVRCGVSLSPQGVGEPFFLGESFASLRVPMLGISGTQDRQQNGSPAENRREGFALWPKGNHRFVWLANAKHLDFTDSSGSSRKAQTSSSREDVQPITRAAILLFLDAHLKSDRSGVSTLTEDGLKPYLKGVVDKVEVLAR